MEFNGGLASGRGTFRPPSVEQALQFTPLSSIAPFSPDIIPYPYSGTSSNASLFPSNDDRFAARRTLDALNAEATSAHSSSVRLQQTINELREYMNREELTQFVFRVPRPQPGAQQTHANPTVNGTAKAPSKPPRLSQFSRRVLNSINVPYQHGPTSVVSSEQNTPEPRKPGRSNNNPNQFTFDKNGLSEYPANTVSYPVVTIPPKTVSPAQPSIERSQHNSASSVQPTSKSLKEVAETAPQMHEHGSALNFQESKSSMNGSKTKLAPAVLIPRLPTSSQRSEYRAFPELDAQIVSGDSGASKKRKHEAINGPASGSVFKSDHRTQIDVAVGKLQRLIDDVMDYAEEPGHSISPGDLDKLDLAIEGVNSLRVLDTLPTDDLLGLQSLCEKKIAPISALQLLMEEDGSNINVQSWLSEISKAQQGLLAAKVSLKITTGAPETKQLAAEELIQTIIDGLRHIVNKVVLPSVRLRSGDRMFNITISQKKPLLDILQKARRVLRLLGRLVAKINITVQAQESLSGLANELLFAENATSEKDSVLGIHQFESARREAMDVVATLVSRYPDRAESACREALAALKDLPVQPHRARQFRLSDGTPIQLVTALLMRITQTTASQQDELGSLVDSFDSSEEESDNSHEIETAKTSRIRALGKTSQALSRAAGSIALLVMTHMVERASTASKTGESPYQRLLELFAEDLVAVLGSPEWPAADVLLAALFSILQSKAKSEDEPVQARSMALDFMGLMGIGIYSLRKAAEKAARKLDRTESDLNERLCRLTEQILGGEADETEIFDMKGPYRVIVEYLLSDGDKLKTSSAVGSRVTEWAYVVVNLLGRTTKTDGAKKLSRVAIDLSRIIVRPRWLLDNYESNTVSLQQAQLASMLASLEKTFCKRSSTILHHLLTSLASSSTTLKSRALKSLLLLLKEDASLLEKHPGIIDRIRRLFGDGSARVRESALRAFAEVLTTSSELDKQMYELIITRASMDPSTAVQTAAMKILKDIYKRHDGDLRIQSSIANAFLRKVSHPEKKSVAEPAIQSLEELWFLPLYVASASDERDPKSKQQLRSLAKLMVQTVEHDPKNTMDFDLLLKTLLSKQTSKNAAANSIVSAHLVSVLYDALIGSSDFPGVVSRRYTLETLGVFAQADATMFTADRLEIMQPYLENLSTGNDAEIYQSVLVIYRHVFPKTKLLQTPFLTRVQSILLKAINKLSGRPLMETALCLQIIADKQNDSSSLVRLVKSAMGALKKVTAKPSDQMDQTDLVKAKRLVLILGAFGQASRLDHEIEVFRDAFPEWKGDEVADLFVDLLAALTGKRHPREIQEAALEAICQVCQAWPRQFMRQDVEKAISLVFINDHRHMETIVLSAFRDFYLMEEKKSETGAVIAVGEGAKTGAQRLGVSLNANENDSASPGIAQKFLKYFTKLALASTDILAVIATEVLASVSRQGLVHPKECGIPFIALETSPNITISSLALQEHKKIHEKHESIIEKDYMKAVSEAFRYQSEVIKDKRGATSQPVASKLHGLFNVLKDGTAKVRRKFFANIVNRLSFDFDKLAPDHDAESDLEYTQFIVEALAFYEPPKIEELWQLVCDMERVVISAGARVLEVINLEVLKPESLGDIVLRAPNNLDAGLSRVVTIGVDSNDQPQPTLTVETAKPPTVNISDARLRQITMAAIRLTLIWETRTFMRRLWGLAKYGKKGPGKDIAAKPPTKLQNVGGDKYMELTAHITSSSSGNPETMIAQCRASAELLSIDYDHKVVGSDDDDADGEVENGYSTPGEDTEGMPSSAGVKRGSSTPSSGKSKKRKISFSERSDTASIMLKKKRGRPSGSISKSKKGGLERNGSHSFDDEDGEGD